MLVVGLFVGIGIATIPLWLGTAISWMLPEEMVNFESYSRKGYERFELKEIEGAVGSLNFSVSQLEAYSPLVWAWKSVRSKSQTPFIAVEDVELRVMSAEREGDPDVENDPSGMFSLFERLQEVDGLLRKWLPYAMIGDLVIDLQGRQFDLQNIRLKDGSLSFEITQLGKVSYGEDELLMQVSLPSHSLPLDIELSLGPEEIFELSLVASGDAKTLAGKFSGCFAANQWSGNAEWSQRGWIPDESELNASQVDLELRRWFGDLPIPRVAGQLQMSSAGATYRVNTSLKVAEGGFDGFLPFYLRNGELELEANGNFEAVDIEQVFFNGDLGRVTTEAPVRFDLREKTLIGTIKGQLTVDLASLEVESLSGLLDGSFEISPFKDTRKPKLSFEMRSQDVLYRDLKAQRAQVAGMVELDQVAISSISLVVSEDSVPESESRIEGSGRYHFSDREFLDILLNSTVDLLHVASLLDTELPTGLLMAELESDITLKPFQANYRGAVTVQDLKVPGLQTLNLQTDLEGSHEHLLLRELQVGNPLQSSVQAEAEMRWGSGFQADLSKFVLSYPGSEPNVKWVLQQPVSVFFEGNDPETMLPNVQVSPLLLKSQDGSLSLKANLFRADTPELDLVIENTAISELAQPWMERLLPDIKIQSAIMNIGIQNSILRVSGSLDAAMRIEDERVSARGQLNWSQQGLDLDSFRLTGGDRDWISLNGQLPYYGMFREGNIDIRLADSKDLALQFQTSNSEEWIPLLQPYVPISVGRAEIIAELAGDIESPTGSLSVAIDTLPGEGAVLVPPAKIRSDILLKGNTLLFNPIRVSVAAENFEFQGMVGFPEEIQNWLKLDTSRTIPWEQVRYEISATQSDLAPIAHFVPHILRPAGNLGFELEGSWERGITGVLNLQNLSTRAIFPFGALRDMSGELSFERSRAELSEFSGKIGRESIEADAWIDFTHYHDPDFEFKLSGQDIPLVRQAGIILRADLDLYGKKTGNEVATIGGNLNLRDGVFLMDVTSLFSGSSGGGRSVSSRPPYFSVETAPFRDWNLNLSLSGDEFMTLKTTVVDGKLSMDMDLEGTLGEPFLLGSVWFDEGNIRFPFASFEIQNGRVLLHREDPYTPILDIVAESSRLDYLLQLNVSGSAAEPEVSFSSSPSLSSDQILMMITAGEDPSGTLEYSNTQKASKIGTYLSKGLLGSGYDNHSSLLSRLSLEWGNKLSKQGKETRDLEFLLNDEFQILGEYDEYDNWNGGIRWRILNPRQHSDVEEPEEVDGEE